MYRGVHEWTGHIPEKIMKGSSPFWGVTEGWGTSRGVQEGPRPRSRTHRARTGATPGAATAAAMLPRAAMTSAAGRGHVTGRAV